MKIDRNRTFFRTENTYRRVSNWIFMCILIFGIVIEIDEMIWEKEVSYLVDLLYFFPVTVFVGAELRTASGKIEFSADGVLYHTWRVTKFFSWDNIRKVTRTEIPSQSLFYPYLVISTEEIIPKGWMILNIGLQKAPVIWAFWRPEVLAALQRCAPERLLPVQDENPF